MTTEELTPAERAAQLQARLSSNIKVFEKPSPPPPKWDADLVPEKESNGYVPTEEDRRLDAFLASLDIIDGYVKLCGKMIPDPNNRRKEGIKISCPRPDHPDHDPSAWISTDKQLWCCGPCGFDGGDIFDLAALKFGYPRPEYKTNGDFPKLRRQLAEFYGFTFVKGVGGTEYGVPPQEAQEATPPPPPPIAIPAPPQPPPSLVTSAPPVVPDNVGPAKVIAFPGTELEDVPEAIKKLSLDWTELCTPGTFLAEWQHANLVAIEQDLPHEYFLFAAKQALGFACGSNIMLADFQPVKPNFFVCLYGPTGIGKTRSTIPYRQLLAEVMPFTGDDKLNDPEGVLLLPTPNSSEALIDNFVFEVLDPSTMKRDHLGSVKGLVTIEEFSSFMARASRMGSTMKDAFIEFKDVPRGRTVTIHSRTTGVVTAYSPFMQVLTTTQPKAIHAFTRRTDTESGLLNRWLFVVGWPRIAPLAYGHKSANISKSADLLRDIVRWAQTERLYQLTGNALAVWTDFFNENMAPMKSGQIEVDSMVSRIDYSLKQIIVVLSANEMLDQPSDAVVEKAIKYFPYLRTTFGMVSGDIVHSESAECQDAIVKVVAQYEAATKRYPTRRDIVRGLGSKFDSETILKSFKILVDLDLIEEIRPQAGDPGRPTTRYMNAQA